MKTIPMKKYEEKKHSVRYNAAEEDAAIKSVYIMKSHLPTSFPEEVTVTLEVKG